MDYLRIIGENKYHRGPPGGHNPPRHARMPKRALVGAALLGPPLVPLFWYISHFDLEKVRSGLLGRSATVSMRNFGRSTFSVRRSDSAGRTSLQNHRNHHHQQLSHLGEVNLHQHLQQHHILSNPSSSLVFNRCTRTSDWYQWVTSSVDYIL